MSFKDQLKEFLSYPSGQMMLTLGVISILGLIALSFMN